VDGAARTAVGTVAVTPDKATFRDVFAVSEFRALWLAQLLSLAGDQLARLAVTVLVYDRTHSALLTAVTYAITFVPWIIGGLTLSGFADRFPRREVMVICDVARLVLVSGMALASFWAPPLAALWIMVSLLFIVTLLDSPFKSARSALVPDILSGDRYVLGTAVSQITIQIGTVSGYALGGVIVAFLSVRVALITDALTFAVSAALIGIWVRARPAALATAAVRAKPSRRSGSFWLVFGHRRLRILMLFGWLIAFYVVPMGLAAPYAASLRSPLPHPVLTGLIFAAGPFGAAVGALIFGRLVAGPARQQAMGPMAVAACALLLLCLLHPSAVGALAILAASGGFASYQLAANAAFVAAVPAELRGRAFGIANGGIQVSQGAWIVLAGAASSAHVLTPGAAIAVSGGIGALAAAALAASWRRQPAGG
jgi:MFS family permease